MTLRKVKGEPVKVDGSSTRPVSPYRDAQFVRDIKRLLHLRRPEDKEGLQFVLLYGSPRSGYSVTFSGSPVSSTNLLKQKSAELYNQHRSLIIRRREAERLT